MAKLKSERHHWWPECVSQYWADGEGGVHWLLPSGKVRRSVPKNFGVIGNGHAIKLGDEPTVGSVWDTSFEAEFQNADNNFPMIIDWLNSLDRCSPPFERSVGSRIVPVPVEDQQFATMIECLISLAARSPKHREQGVALAEEHRGPLPERERNALIGANIQRTLRNAVRNLGGRGKAMVIFSPEREFIFGDGFFHNLTVQGDHWHHPKMLVPLTPWMSVLFTRPRGYTVEPRLVTFVANKAEADELNYAVQVYAREMLFYRSECPQVDEAFTCGVHKIFADDRNAVDTLVYEIPGVPPRDPNMDEIIDFLERYAKR
ncbi:MAG: hypothetical protein ACOVQ0_06840 [Novosphingobium sp.]|uniref:hypothetical protein n=1 Tax=Novosphingobium sp. TaxID=1874826 RepID=UPI003B9A35B9